MTRTWILTTEKLRVSSITLCTWIVGYIVLRVYECHFVSQLTIDISFFDTCTVNSIYDDTVYIPTLNHNLCFILSSFLHHLTFLVSFFFIFQIHTYECGSNKNQQTKIRRTKINLFNCCLQQYLHNRHCQL